MISDIFLSGPIQLSYQFVVVLAASSELMQSLHTCSYCSYMYNVRTSLLFFFFFPSTVLNCTDAHSVIMLYTCFANSLQLLCLFTLEYNFSFFSAMLFFKDIKSRITKLEDMKNRRLEFLRNRYKDTYNAVIWLRENQHRFKGPVHEPILLQVSEWVSVVKNLFLEPQKLLLLLLNI